MTFEIGHLTNYGQNAYLWTFKTFSYGGKCRNDTKPNSVSRQESKNRKIYLKFINLFKNRI